MVTNKLFSPGYGLNTILLLLLIAGVIFGFFYCFKRYFLPYIDAKKTGVNWPLVGFRLEVIVWLLFALFALTEFMVESLFVTIGLVVVVGLIGFNFWRDFFPGLWMRLSDKYRVADLVRIDPYMGTIVKVGITSIHIKTDEEELAYIPYHKISSQIFVKRQAKGKLMSTKLMFHLGNKNQGVILDNVDRWIGECPWAVPQASHAVNLQPGGIIYVTVYAVDEFSLGKIEQYLNQRIQTTE